MDEYQKQFKTYLETKDKDVKEMIEKYDDTLKTYIAPKNNTDSQPVASNVYANQEGEEISEKTISQKGR